mgnify:CR=1 FL=1
MTLPTLPREPSKLLPVLRSIARELRQRKALIVTLEARRNAFSESPKIHGSDLANTDAELAIQRRELRRVTKELELLGCRVEDDEPLRIALPDEGRTYTFSWELDQTQFYSQPLGAKAAETSS